MKTLFAVEWIEIDFGSRPEGYKVFDNVEDCIESTVRSSKRGTYTSGEGYCGPVRPLNYFETPDEIEGPFPKFVDKIEFKGNQTFIKV